MIVGFLNTLKTCTEFFVSFGIVIVFIVLLSSTILRGVQKTSRKRVATLSILNLSVSIILSVLAFLVFVLITKSSYENLDLYLLFTLIFSLNLNLSLAVNIRREISRAKKSMSFRDSIQESVKDSSKKILDVAIYYLLFLVAIIFLTNRETGSLVGSLFIPVLVCSLVSAFASRPMCTLSEKIFK